MDSTTIVGKGCGDDGTKGGSVFDSKCPMPVNDASNADNARLTAVEQLYLDYLETKIQKAKEQKGKQKSIVYPTPVKYLFRRVPEPKSSTTIGTKPPLTRSKMSPEDRSVMKAMEELNGMSDADLTRAMRQCENDEAGGGTESGDILAWWMTRSVRGGQTSEMSRVGGTKGKKLRQPMSKTAVSRRSNSSNGGRIDPSTPRPIKDEQGRILFSFMQAPPEQNPSTSAQDMDDDFDIDLHDFKNGSFGPQSHLRGQIDVDEDIKRPKGEQRRSKQNREESEEENDDEDSFSSDLDGLPESLVEAARMKPKSKKKKNQPVVSLWDPDQPRPLPRRLLRSKLAVPKEKDVTPSKNPKTCC